MKHDDRIPSRYHEELSALHSYLNDLRERLDVALADIADMRERQRLADLKAEKQS